MKHMNARQRNYYKLNLEKAAKDMENAKEIYQPPDRLVSMLLKEKEAFIDDNAQPLSYGMILEQQNFREYVKTNPGEQHKAQHLVENFPVTSKSVSFKNCCGAKGVDSKSYFFESFHNRFKKCISSNTHKSPEKEK